MAISLVDVRYHRTGSWVLRTRPITYAPGRFRLYISRDFQRSIWRVLVKADPQFAYKTVSYGNLRKFRETRVVIKIAQKALMNKRLRTKDNFGKISQLYLYCTSLTAQGQSNCRTSETRTQTIGQTTNLDSIVLPSDPCLRSVYLYSVGKRCQSDLVVTCCSRQQLSIHSIKPNIAD